METNSPATTEDATHGSTPRQRLFFALILIAAAAIYSFRLGSDALGASEAYSAWAAAKPGVSAILRIPVLHDPGKQVFYYIVLHYFTSIFGTGESALRAVSVIFALASIALVYALGREMFDTDTALAAVAMWAFNPLAVVFAHRARMYSMFIAVALAHLLALWRVRSRPNALRAIVTGILGAALLYTHLGGALIVGAEVAMLARDYLRGRRNPAAWLAIALTLALFVPYVPVVRTQSQTLLKGHWLDWIGAAYAYPVYIKLIAIGLGAVIAAWFVLSENFESALDEPLRWLCAWAILPTLALAVGSIVLRPMYNTRYTAPALAAIALIVARAIALASVKWRNLAAAGIAVACLIVLRYDQPDPQPWRDFARQITASGDSAEPIIFESGFFTQGPGANQPNGGFPFGYYSVPFNYYFSGANPRVTVPGYDPESARTTIESRVSAAGGGWLVSWKDPAASKSELPDPDHFQVVEKYRQPDLVIYRITPASPPATR
jgi:4-amino-4-deoxy-L-arabinose transferase-like glycosyltransferase